MSYDDVKIKSVLALFIMILWYLQIINIQDIIRSKSIDEMKDVYVSFYVIHWSN